MITHNAFFYDIEVVHGLFMCAVIPVEPDDNNVRFFTHHNAKEFIDFLDFDCKMLIGYNNSGYDDIMLREGLRCLFNPVKLKKISDKIISTKKGERYDTSELARLPCFTIDVASYLFSVNTMRPLKLVAANLGFSNVLDSPVDFNQKSYTNDEIKRLTLYNINDVLALKYVFYKTLSKFRLKVELSEMENMDVMNASDTRFAKKQITKYFSGLGMTEEMLTKPHPNEQSNIRFGDIIDPSITFDNPTFQKFLTELKTYDSDTFKSKNKVTKKKIKQFTRLYVHDDLVLQFGGGGLHSEDKPAVLRETELYSIEDQDVSSMYPSYIINNALSPLSFTGFDFPGFVKYLTDKRLTAKKKSKDENLTEAQRALYLLESESLKITINSIYGLFGSEYWGLYSPRCMYSVTINGQLWLMKFVEMLHNAGISVVSANTDGVTYLVKKNSAESALVKQIIKRWETESKFNLEKTSYDLYVRLNVNNYFARKVDDGKTSLEDRYKFKGFFEQDVKYSKSLRGSILSTALMKFYVDGVPIEDSVTSHTELQDFMFTKKADKRFTVEYYESSTKSIEQNTFRYFLSKNPRKVFTAIETKNKNVTRFKDQYDLFGYVEPDTKESRKILSKEFNTEMFNYADENYFWKNVAKSDYVKYIRGFKDEMEKYITKLKLNII